MYITGCEQNFNFPRMCEFKNWFLKIKQRDGNERQILQV